MKPQITRSITLNDMVSLREVEEPRLSPDAKIVAFLLKQAFRDCDCYRWALYTVAAKAGSLPKKVLEESYLNNIHWLPDGKSISYLSAKSGSVQLWRVDLESEATSQVLSLTANRDRTLAHTIYQSSYRPPSAVLDYAWAPDARSIVFVTEPEVNSDKAQQASRFGFHYDDDLMSTGDLMVGDWAKSARSMQLWIYRPGEGDPRLAWSTPPAQYSSIGGLWWTSDSRRVAFYYTRNADTDSLEVLEASSLKVSHLADAGGQLFSGSAGSLSPDNASIAFLMRPSLANYSTLSIVDLKDGRRVDLSSTLTSSLSPWTGWDVARRRMVFSSEGLGRSRNQAGIYSIPMAGGKPERATATNVKISSCDRIQGQFTACIWQSPSDPPQPALVSLKTGGVLKLADVNPEISSVALGPVQELHWKNSYGDETNGFLVLPRALGPRSRIPLVVVAYGFNGDFVTQGNSFLTTYPVQALARDGIASLLFNYPRFEGWDGPDFAKGSRAFGYGPLASIEAIVKQLDDQGIIDPARVGIMGHSLGGFWVELGISQTQLFKAAELHNGGTASEPASYWNTGNAGTRAYLSHVMGGPPFGPTLKNYLGYSITLNADKVHAPVLMEYDAMEAIDVMDVYSVFKGSGVPVDLYVYPNDGHVTERPEHRFASLQLNLDWFEFWLLDKENHDTNEGAEQSVNRNGDKEAQYSRWRELRKQALLRDSH